jgi:hypothetical protein
MKKVSIKYSWNELLTLQLILSDFCAVPIRQQLAPCDKLLLAQLQVMYVKIAPKTLIHRTTTRISYDAVAAFAMIYLWTSGKFHHLIGGEYNKYVLQTTVATLDQAFA